MVDRREQARVDAPVHALRRTSEIAQTFTELFESKTFGELARSRFGAELPGTLAASVIPETNLLKLSVTADNPADAFRTLRFLMENYNVLSDHVFQNVILRELDSPVVPTAPSNPLSLRPAAKKAFLIGALAMMLGLLAAGVLSDTSQPPPQQARRIQLRPAQFSLFFHLPIHPTTTYNVAVPVALPFEQA